MATAERTVTLASGHGLHARPASLLVQAVTASKHSVTIEKDGSGKAPVAANSILAVLGLAAESGDTLHIAVDGDDADKVADDLTGILTTDHDA